MHKILKLIKWEFLIQNKVHNFIKYLLSLFLFGTICIALVSNHAYINEFGIIFTIIYVPIALLGFSAPILKADLDDGTIEVMLTNFSSTQIILAKFIALYVAALLACLINLSIVFIAFNISVKLLIKLVITLSLELFLTCALTILIGCVQSYFRSSTNFLPQLLMILVIPAVILAGLAIDIINNNSLILILFGMNMILVPIMVCLASYLVRNIFN